MCALQAMKKFFKAIFLWQLLEGCMIRGEKGMIRYPADENASFGYCVYKRKKVGSSTIQPFIF